MYMSTSQLFNDKELIVSKNSNGDFLSSGFTVNSLLWKNAMSPISSVGGGVSSSSKVSSLFDNLAVPAGLMYQKASSHGGKSWTKEMDLALDENYTPKNEIIIPEIHTKLTAKAAQQKLDINKKRTQRNKTSSGNKNTKKKYK